MPKTAHCLLRAAAPFWKCEEVHIGSYGKCSRDSESNSALKFWKWLYMINMSNICQNYFRRHKNTQSNALRSTRRRKKFASERQSVVLSIFVTKWSCKCHSQWPRGLRRRSTAARLLRSWVRIPPGAWMSVCCECCVLSRRGLFDELITRPEESYRLWCVVVCDLET